MELTIKRPDDWHLHLRDGAMLEGILPHTAKDFARAIIMPVSYTHLTLPTIYSV